MNTRLLSDIPMIDAGYFEGMIADMPLRMAEPAHMKEFRKRLAPVATVEDGIATIPIEGPLAYAPDVLEMVFLGVEDSRGVLSAIESAKQNPAARGILLNIHSPGGMMMGGFEIADAIAGAGKPVVAWSGGLVASLAYLFASQADALVTTRSAQVGSIGTIVSFKDFSAMFEKIGVRVEVMTNKEATLKGAGIQGTTLTEEQRGHIQGQLDKSFALFKAQVLSKRPGVKLEAMKGQMMFGSEAKEAGLVDAIGDMSFARSMLRRMI